jgi:phenylalanine-4-hydroxylase
MENLDPRLACVAGGEGHASAVSEGNSEQGSTELVHLDRDHPGFRDPVYRARRNAIARAAIEYRDGDPAPLIEYTPEEHAVWRTVWENLSPLHERYACAAWHDGGRRLALSRTEIPQLRDVNRELAPLTGFRLLPVAGLVTPAAFLRALGRGVFLSTQYMRHASAPLYTPEPDIVHELVGHAMSLAQPEFARLNRLFGEIAMSVGEEAMRGLINVYWYTLEFGVAKRGDALEVYGAGLLSSYGEIGRFETKAELLPFDLDRIAATPFDPTDYQSQLFVAPSFAAMSTALTAWLERHR